LQPELPAVHSETCLATLLFDSSSEATKQDAPEPDFDVFSSDDKGCCCCQLWMAGTGHQSYVTTLKCPATGSVTNTATLLAATGQRLTATANVVKNCFDLTVRLGAISPPTIAK
jgi:hypothetical protein